MQFNDTSGKSGILQDIEFWCGFADGTITGDTTLQKVFTRLVNLRGAAYLSKAQLLSGTDGVEDTNYTKQNFSTFALVSGQNDYQFLTDADGNTISDITGVHILQSASATEYEPMERLSLSDTDAQLIMSPNTDNTGTPTGYIERNNTIFFNVIPNYDHATGGKLFYRLVPSYFAYNDTTKAPGIAEPFHRLYSMGPAYDWLLVNKPENTTLISRLEAKLPEMESDFESYMRQKNPTRSRLTVRQHSTR